MKTNHISPLLFLAKKDETEKLMVSAKEELERLTLDCANAEEEVTEEIDSDDDYDIADDIL